MKKEVTEITPEAMQKLMFHDWPGNVRELANTIEYAVAMTTKNVIGEELVLPHRNNDCTNLQIKPLKEAKEEFEKSYLINLLELAKGNISRAAEMASKYRADFYNLLKKYNLNSKDFKK